MSIIINHSKIFLIIISIIFGISSGISILANFAPELKETQLDNSIFLASIFLIYCLTQPFLFLQINIRINEILDKFDLSKKTREVLAKYNYLTYIVFLLTIGGLYFINFNEAFILMLIILFIIAQIFLLLLITKRQEKINIASSRNFIPIIFLFSGFSALIYQILWQRELFINFGINIEAVTVIVSVFMFGLGTGAILGGAFSRYYPQYSLNAFLIIEIIIGIYGAFSTKLIHMIDQFGPFNSLLELTLASYAILILPTLLMGATLPLLVNYLNRYYLNIGKIVGTLYALNTIGSAIAAFLTIAFLIVIFGKEGTLIISACINFITAFVIYYYKKLHDNKLIVISESLEDRVVDNFHKIKLSLALLLSFFIGYISLSQEIIWFRTLDFMTGGAAENFALVLFSFLIGIGVGALKTNRIFTNKTDYINYITYSLIIVAIIFFISFPLIAYLNDITHLGYFFGYIMIGLNAYFIAPIFPIISHIANIKKENASLSVSFIYAANVIGATLGPIITGFILFDLYSLQQNIMLIICLLVVVIAILTLLNLKRDYRKIFLITSIILLVINHQKFYILLLEKLQFHHVDKIYRPFKQVIENKSGIITVSSSENYDIIYGGGIYDGKINTDPLNDRNGIFRAYMIAALHPKPTNILMIGLSGGAWSKIVSSSDNTKSIDIVEINEAYHEIIKEYPLVASILDDKRIKIHIADGRHWIKLNTERKYDLIIMNTTFHWRSNANNLLSKEFLEMCKKLLNKNGVLYLNTTKSDDVTYTMANVFRHVVKIHNFAAASDTPFLNNKIQIKNNLLSFKNDQNKPIFTQNEDYLKLLEFLLSVKLIDIKKSMQERKDLWLITDDNLATEFKKRQHFYSRKSKTNWQIITDMLRTEPQLVNREFILIN